MTIGFLSSVAELGQGTGRAMTQGDDETQREPLGVRLVAAAFCSMQVWAHLFAVAALASHLGPRVAEGIGGKLAVGTALFLACAIIDAMYAHRLHAALGFVADRGTSWYRGVVMAALPLSFVVLDLPDGQPVHGPLFLNDEHAYASSRFLSPRASTLLAIHAARDLLLLVGAIVVAMVSPVPPAGTQLTIASGGASGGFCMATQSPWANVLYGPALLAAVLIMHMHLRFMAYWKQPTGRAQADPRPSAMPRLSWSPASSAAAPAARTGASPTKPQVV